MNPERWRRIKEVLDVTLRLEPAERAGYLTRVCESDTEMRDEVESLLAAHQATGEWLETPVLEEPADPLLGTRLGPYQVVELIGHGGMGSVYRGIRVDEAFHKEVAIKVVRRGLDLDRVVRQFRRERQITASLEHPNIATLIDGGTTPEALPYFVMEFIRGKPIDVYCDEQGLKTRARVELFATVCAAVQFAHQLRSSPPRHQAGQCPGHEERHAEAARFRRRQGSESRHSRRKCRNRSGLSHRR